MNESPKSLSPREIEILQLYANGLRTTDIARELGIGLQTVKSHTKRARAKFGSLQTTCAAVCAALRYGLIE